MTLYQFPPAFGLPVSVSPYCAKLELYFRLTGRDYDTAKGNLLQSPTKSVPYVRIDGQLVGDSEVIIARLEAAGPALDAGAPEHDLSELVAEANRAMYYSCLHSRFEDGWAHQKPTVHALLPPVIGWMAAPFIRKDQLGKCAKAGIGSHDDHDQAVQLLQHLDAQLGDTDFMVDDQPRVADCALWGHTMAMAYTLVPSAPRDAIRANDRVMGWIKRLGVRAGWDWPDPA